MGPPFSLSRIWFAFGPWTWKRYVAADHGPAARVAGGALVPRGLDVVPAGRRVELEPVGRRRAAHVDQLVGRQVEQDAVADHVAVVVARREVLGAVHREFRERVEREMRAELEGVRPLDVQVEHVVRLVEQHGGVTPRPLLVAPVRVFRRHHRVHVGADLRVAQHLGHVARPLNQALQILSAHKLANLSHTKGSRPRLQAPGLTPPTDNVPTSTDKPQTPRPSG